MWWVVGCERGVLRRVTDRRVVQSDVVAPDGHRYRVAICRNLPWRGSSLLSGRDLTMTAISAAALLARAISARGRFGWTITVAAAETEWRAARTVYRERSRDAEFVVDQAIDLAREIRGGGARGRCGVEVSSAQIGDQTSACPAACGGS